MSMSSNSFRTGEPSMVDLLEQIHAGEIQLPDFQRGWVWDDKHIRSLIASISRSFPIGSVMLLETGGDGVRFKPRLVHGTPETAKRQPGRLILDGQQRMTSLYLALRSGQPVPTRTEDGKDIERVYYLDLAACLEEGGDREDAVLSLPPNRMRLKNFNREVELDLSTAEQEYEKACFPLSVLLSNQYYAWCQGFRKHHNFAPAKMEQLDQFEREVVQRFRIYRLPTIELTRDTSKEAVCQVFEKVNTGGVALTVFELMTATYAADDHDLRKEWDDRRARLREHEVLRELTESEFLQATTLLASYERSVAAGMSPGISCKRRDILDLSLADYRDRAPRVERGLVSAARLLVREKIFDSRNLPYGGQLVPLSAICAVLGDRFESDGVKQKLARWLWCGVLGELYGGASETRFANDIVDVLAWISGKDEPRTVRDASFSPTRLLTLQTRQSAAYKGISALLMQIGSHDFINGDSIELTSFFDLAIDIHHIFPRAYCEKQKYDRYKWNSIVNKAPITARTNRILGGHAPSRYLASIEQHHEMTPKRLDEILRSHLITPQHLRGDDLDAFVRARARAMLDLVEKAMGKAVGNRDSEEVLKVFGGSLTADAT